MLLHAENCCRVQHGKFHMWHAHICWSHPIFWLNYIYIYIYYIIIIYIYVYNVRTIILIIVIYNISIIHIYIYRDYINNIINYIEIYTYIYIYILYLYFLLSKSGFMSHELFGPQGLQCCVSAVGRSVPSILGWRLRCAVQRWSCGGLGQCGLRRVRASDWAENCWTWDGKKDKLEENLGIWRWIFRKEHGNQTLKTMFFF